MRTNLSDVFSPAERAALKPKIVERNTFRYTRPDGATVIRLHRTDILEIRPDGTEVMNSGGWRSMTTKDRLANYSKFRIYQEKGNWFVRNPQDGVTVPYFDGITLPRDFAPQGQAKAARALDARAKLDKELNKFVALIGKDGAPLPKPDSGDCWYCAMRTEPGDLPENARDIGVTVQEASKFGVTMGDSSGDVSHLLEHVNEGYMHGSLIINALVAAGWNNPGIAWQISDVRRVRRAVLNYLRARLLPS